MILFLIALIVFYAILDMINWNRAINERLKEMEQKETLDLIFVAENGLPEQEEDELTEEIESEHEEDFIPL